MEAIQIKISRTDASKDLPLPQYMTEGAAGMDLIAAVENPMILEPNTIKLVPTGLIMAIPLGYEGQIRPRSGLALKHGIGLVNSPGTIDADFRGEIQIIMINLGKEPFIIERGDRIAQMVFNKVAKAQFILVDKLDTTSRDKGGFGHTGV